MDSGPCSTVQPAISSSCGARRHLEVSFDDYLPKGGESSSGHVALLVELKGGGSSLLVVTTHLAWDLEELRLEQVRW